jgi:hypothetical protein
VVVLANHLHLRKVVQAHHAHLVGHVQEKMLYNIPVAVLEEHAPQVFQLIATQTTDGIVQDSAQKNLEITRAQALAVAVVIL